jgi:hypothetical protein
MRGARDLAVTAGVPLRGVTEDGRAKRAVELFRRSSVLEEDGETGRHVEQ